MQCSCSQTRLLITHTTAFLPQTDFIIMLENGSVLESGTFEQLSEKSKHFNEFLQIHATNTEEKGDEGTKFRYGGVMYLLE